MTNRYRSCDDLYRLDIFDEKRLITALPDEAAERKWP